MLLIHLYITVLQPLYPLIDVMNPGYLLLIRNLQVHVVPSNKEDDHGGSVVWKIHSQLGVGGVYVDVRG